MMESPCFTIQMALEEILMYYVIMEVFFPSLCLKILNKNGKRNQTIFAWDLERTMLIARLYQLWVISLYIITQMDLEEIVMLDGIMVEEFKTSVPKIILKTFFAQLLDLIQRCLQLLKQDSLQDSILLILISIFQKSNKH